jgi:hypothetical protein
VHTVYLDCGQTAYALGLGGGKGTVNSGYGVVVSEGHELYIIFTTAFYQVLGRKFSIAAEKTVHVKV